MLILSVAHINTGMETLELFKEVLRWQRNRYEEQGDWDTELESELIVDLARKTGADNFVDYGVWAGLLAKQIFKRMPDLKDYYAVDAIPIYLELTKEAINDPRLVTVEALIYSDYSKPHKDHFYVDLFNSIGSSGIYTNKTLHMTARHLIEVPAAKPTYVKTFLDQHPELLRENCYVKMDIDGSDVPLMHHYLNRSITTGIKPKVLQFELWGFLIPRIWDVLSSHIIKAGYVLPDFNFRDDNLVWLTVSISEKDWWIIYLTKNPREKITIRSWSDQKIIKQIK